MPLAGAYTASDAALPSAAWSQPPINSRFSATALGGAADQGCKRHDSGKQKHDEKSEPIEINGLCREHDRDEDR